MRGTDVRAIRDVCVGKMLLRLTARFCLLAVGMHVLAAQSVASPARACAAGMPCILAVYNKGTDLIVEWNDTDERDRYNFRWSRPGKAEQQFETPGGRGGSFTIGNFHRNTSYTFKVQGCKKPLIGRSSCTSWYQEDRTSCGSTKDPCR